MEYVVLGYLRKKAMTGYGLKKEMEKGTGYFYDASFGSIYPTLNKLEKKGWIERDTVHEGNKKKIYYAPTKEGLSALREWLETSADDFRMRYDFLAKLFFSKGRDKDRICQAIAQHQDQLTVDRRKMLETYELIQAFCDPYELYTLKFGIDFLQFLDSFYEDVKKDLSGKSIQE